MPFHPVHTQTAQQKELAKQQRTERAEKRTERTKSVHFSPSDIDDEVVQRVGASADKVSPFEFKDLDQYASREGLDSIPVFGLDVSSEVSGGTISKLEHDKTLQNLLIEDLNICFERSGLKSKSYDGNNDDIDSENESVNDLSDVNSANLSGANLILAHEGLLHESDSDSSDSETEMAAGMNPPIFRGVHADDPQAFWQYASLWMSTKRHQDEHTKIKNLALFLADRAAIWFRGIRLVAPPGQDAALNPGECDTFEHFGEQFLLKFRVDDNANWREVFNLWGCRQGPTETTEEFCGRLQKLADTARADNRQVIQAALNGLRSDVQAVVLLQNITSIDDIVRWGTASEQIKKPTSSAEIASEVAKILDVKFEQKFNSLSMRPVEEMQARGRPVSPRVKFREDEGVQARAPNRSPAPHPVYQARDYGSDHPQYPRDSARDNAREAYSRAPMVGDSRGNLRRWSGPNSDYRQGQSRSSFTHRSGDFRSNSDFKCNKCALSHGPRECPAFNIVCRRCLGTNHYARCCNNRGGGRNMQRN